LSAEPTIFFGVYDRIVVPSSILRCRIAAMTPRQHDNAAEGYLRGVPLDLD
jgi:hypothetical protein